MNRLKRTHIQEALINRILERRGYDKQLSRLAWRVVIHYSALEDLTVIPEQYQHLHIHATRNSAFEGTYGLAQPHEIVGAEL
jgi:hypothetical protein